MCMVRPGTFVFVVLIAMGRSHQCRDQAPIMKQVGRGRASLYLRGGGDAVRPTAVLKKVASKVDTLEPHETKPDLKRHPSRLVLNDGDITNATNATMPRPKDSIAFRIDGKEVSRAHDSATLL